jgi:hypothetical protein
MRRFISKLVNSVNVKAARAAKRRERRAGLRLESLERRDLMTIFIPPIVLNPVDPIKAEYAATANETDCNGTSVQQILGAPTGGEGQVPGLSGTLMQTFQGGTIYYSADSGAHVVYGDVATKYASPDVGGPGGYGLPTSDEAAVPGVPGVRVTTFQFGHAIYWSPATGPHTVYGDIGIEYTATGGETDCNGTSVQRILGAPTSDEMNAPVAGGRMNTFQGGTIYWSAGTGAHVVYGDVATKYASPGVWGPSGYGLPTSDEAPVLGVPGVRVTTFQFGHAIYWSPATGPHTVYGDIGIEYTATGGEVDYYGNIVRKVLGAPTSDEMDVPGVAGRMNTFQGGTIYWSPSTGAHVVYGSTAAQYASQHGPTGSLGLPTGDEQAIIGGRFACFQNGDIGWTPQGGACAVPYPTATAAYSPASGSLFVHYDKYGNPLPDYRDVQQGTLGDCWLMASLAETAARAPSDITNMFSFKGNVLANGNWLGVYTVRLYDSFTGAAQSITVDTELPGGGTLYDNTTPLALGGKTTVLWAALAEKAYAEANARGLVSSSNPGFTSYSALGSGWPQWALHAITGQSADRYDINPTGLGFNLVSAWNAGELIVLATSAPDSSYIASPHAYALVGYNPSSNLPFTVFNPWGTDANGWAPNKANTKYGLFTADAAFLSKNFTTQTLGLAAAPGGPQGHPEGEGRFTGPAPAGAHGDTAGLHAATAVLDTAPHQSHSALDLVFAQAARPRKQAKAVDPFAPDPGNGLDN